MSITFYAQPYDLEATGFYFRDVETFREKSKNLKNDYGEIVEEFEIQFIDGSAIDAALFKAVGVYQSNIGHFIDKANAWNEHDKILFIIACQELGYSIKLPSNDPGDFDIDLQGVEDLHELAHQFADEGLLGDIPENLSSYLDYDSIARDLAHDYTETTIAGMKLVYRAG